VGKKWRDYVREKDRLLCIDFVFNNYGKTPLSHGHGGVVKILLAREEVKPDKPGDAHVCRFFWT